MTGPPPSGSFQDISNLTVLWSESGAIGFTTGSDGVLESVACGRSLTRDRNTVLVTDETGF